MFEFYDLIQTQEKYCLARLNDILSIKNSLTISEMSDFIALIYGNLSPYEPTSVS